MENFDPALNTKNLAETDQQEKKLLEEFKQQTQEVTETANLVEDEIKDQLHEFLFESGASEESKSQRETQKDITQEEQIHSQIQMKSCASEGNPTPTEPNEQKDYNQDVADLPKHVSASLNLIQNQTPPTIQAFQQPSLTAFPDEEEEKMQEEEAKMEEDEDFLGECYNYFYYPSTKKMNLSSFNRLLALYCNLKLRGLNIAQFKDQAHLICSNYQTIQLEFIQRFANQLLKFWENLSATRKIRNEVYPAIQEGSSDDQLLTVTRDDGLIIQDSQSVSLDNNIAGGEIYYNFKCFFEKVQYQSVNQYQIFFVEEKKIRKAIKAQNLLQMERFCQKKIKDQQNKERYEQESLKLAQERQKREQISLYYKRLDRLIAQHNQMIEEDRKYEEAFRERMKALEERQEALFKREEALIEKEEALIKRQAALLESKIKMRENDRALQSDS